MTDEHAMRGDVLIVQPYVPSYRQAFFERCIEQFEDRGIVARVAAPATLGSQRERGDAVVGDSPWRLVTKGRELNTPAATFTYYGSARLQSRFRVIVAPAAATCLDSQLAVTRGKAVLWGHIAPSVKAPSRLDTWLEGVMLRRSRHVLAYTEAGRSAGLDARVEADHITVLNNTVDLGDLRASMAELHDSEVRAFEQRHHLVMGKTFAFVGGFDSSKRIDLLADTLDHWWAEDRDVKLLVGGRGPDARLLAKAVERRQVVDLGYAGDHEKALIARVAKALIVPGRVGLIAVEAMAMGLPIVTTTDALHGPEVDYLREGIDIVTVSPHGSSLASTALAIAEPGAVAAPPEIEAMVESFVEGVSVTLA